VSPVPGASAVAARLGATRLRRHPHAGALCLFAAVIGGVYWPVVDGTRSLVTNGPWSQPLFVIDPLAGGPITAPLTRLAASSWLHLRLPVLDPFQGFGIPLLSNQGVPVYPPQVLAHLLFPDRYSIWLVVDLIALAFGVYLLARAFGLPFFGAVSAGFLAALAGAAPPNVNMSMLNPLAVLPFVLVAVRYALDPESRHRRPAMLGVATSVAFLCLSGFQEVLPLMAVVIVVYTAGLVVHHRTWRQRPLLIAGAAASACAGVAIGSIGILPTLAVAGAGTTVNGPTRYLSHFPAFWLSTLTFPTITGRALNQAPQDLGNTVNTLGTPLLVLVVVLAVVISVGRRGAHTRWFVFPSVVLVVFGMLAYADIGRVLDVMDLPLFDTITADRFVQFAWWIPLCLLVGVVVTHPRALGWAGVGIGLLVAGAFDAYFFVRFRQELAAGHVAIDASVSHAPIVAGAVVLVFVAAILAVRRLGTGLSGLVMAAAVLGSCVYDVPTNFAPASYGGAVTSVAVPRPGATAGHLAYYGNRQLPTDGYSVQVYGPVVPKGYAAVLTGLYSDTETGGVGPLYGAVPTIAELTLTPRAVSVLASMGVDLLVLPSALSGPGFTEVPACGTPPGGARGAVCFLGEVPSPQPGVGYAPAEAYEYRVAGADPLVQRTATLVPVRSTKVATERLSHELSASLKRMPRKAYVRSGATRLEAARGVRGLSKRATTEQVSVVLHSSGAGLAVLRDSYETGMRATVDGRRVAALPVDGGLWTAVEVRPGDSRVVLDYVTSADLVELWLAVVGLSSLALLWAAVVVLGWRRRRQHRLAADARSEEGGGESVPEGSRAPILTRSPDSLM
jgi:hypothetical protein